MTLKVVRLLTINCLDVNHIIPWNQKYTFYLASLQEVPTGTTLNEKCFSRTLVYVLSSIRKHMSERLVFMGPTRNQLLPRFQKPFKPLSKVQQCGWTINTPGSAGKFPEFFTEHEF